MVIRYTLVLLWVSWLEWCHHFTRVQNDLDEARDNAQRVQTQHDSFMDHYNREMDACSKEKDSIQDNFNQRLEECERKELVRSLPLLLRVKELCFACVQPPAELSWLGHNVVHISPSPSLEAANISLTTALDRLLNLGQLVAKNLWNYSVFCNHAISCVKWHTHILLMFCSAHVQISKEIERMCVLLYAFQIAKMLYVFSLCRASQLLQAGGSRGSGTAGEMWSR